MSPIRPVRATFHRPPAAVLADAALLWGMALVIAWLGWSGNYSMLLNPRFLWLTLLTGAVLAVLGAAVLLRGVAGASSGSSGSSGSRPGPRPVPLRRALLLGLLLCVSLTATVDWWGVDATPPQDGMVTGRLGGEVAGGLPPADAGSGPDVRPDAPYDDPDAFAGPPDAFEASGRPGPFDDAPAPAGGDDELGPRATYGGTEYVRINLAELFLLEQRDRPEELAGRYVFRGAVTRHPALDAQGAVAVFRVSLYCCLADATAGGFAVRPGVREPAGKPHADARPAPEPGTAPTRPVPASRDILAGLGDGQWVEVYGHLTREKLPAKLARLAPRDVFAGSLNSGWVFTADAVRLIPPPGDPFIFQWREAEPYLW
ncbi:hypothetical protein [Nitratidesulfovibrio sp. 1201_IL3209]|uniref:hypothetical protein n=1 Tax=Nitratidesulfovibrio sp. 1201_IL3209 TaxID=3084053 RepID=UPI002FDA204C